MTIAFTRLFTTEGLECGALNELNTARGTTYVTRAATLTTQYETSTVYNALVSGLQTTLTNAQTADNGYANALAANALSVLSAEVLADRPLNGTTLQALITELVRQMGLNSQTLNSCPTTVTPSSIGSPTGDTQFVWNTYEGPTGLQSDYCIPETINTNCTRDQSTGATAYQEAFAIAGTPPTTPTTNANYPTGSGVNVTVSAADPAVNGGLVSDPNFSKWGTGASVNTPSAWSIFSGTAGTNVFQATGTDPRGGTGSSLKLVGDGVTVVKVRIPVAVSANSTYVVAFRTNKVNDPGANRFAVSLFLTDGVGNLLNGNASYSNEVDSASSGTMTSNWNNSYTGVFLTPAVLPTTGTFLEIRLHRVSANTTAADNATAVYVDYVPFLAQTQLYAGGPTLQLVSGLTAAVVGDQRKAVLTLTSGTIAGHMIRGLDRLLGLAAVQPRIPTIGGGASTISDTLVV